MTIYEFFTKLIILKKTVSRLSFECANTLNSCDGLAEPGKITELATRGFHNVEELQALDAPTNNDQLLKVLTVFLDTAKLANDIFSIACLPSAYLYSLSGDEEKRDNLLVLMAMRHATVSLVQELSNYDLE